MKKFLSVLAILFLTSLLSGCDSKEGHIIFNKTPITKNTISESTNVFRPGDRIFYLITTPKEIKSKYILIQVVKMGKEERLGYELVWGKQVKMRDEQIYYYTDYIVLNETGAYTMRAIARDNPTKVFATNNFYIRE